MSAILTMPAEEILERVDLAAARGDRRADRILEVLVAEELRTGGLSVVGRLSVRRYVAEGDAGDD